MKCKNCKKNTAFELFCSPECALLYKKIKENENITQNESNINFKKSSYNKGCGCNK
jgi:hypothetical protein